MVTNDSDQATAPSGVDGRARRVDTTFLRRVIVTAALAKLAAMTVRIWVIYDVYGGASDVGSYVDTGRRIAGQLRSGTIPPEATNPGTTGMEFVVGVIFAVIGANRAAAFFVLTMLAFIGLVLFYRAFELGVPEGNHRRYALLVFFLPTMLFWTSSIGKEAWMTFGFGLAAYGAARIYARHRFGYPTMAAGVGALFFVRPHMAALFAAAFTIGFLLRPVADGGRRRWGAWLVGVAVAATAVMLTLGAVEDELPRDESVGGSVFDQVTAETEDRTSKGGSEFDNRPVSGPADFAIALVTVPFRPFPWEGDNLQAMLAGLEGLGLIALTIWSLPSLARLPRRVLRIPYLALSLAYTTAFVIAFSAIGNFGILVRQRSQLLPFFIVLLCIDRLAGKRSKPLTAPSDLAPSRLPAGRAGVLVPEDEGGAYSPTRRSGEAL